MHRRFDKETRAKAVRLVQEHRSDYESEYAAIKAVSARLGMTAETLRKWVRQSEVDSQTELNRSSQHQRVEERVAVRSSLRLASSSRVSCVAGC
jgi:transposase